MIDHVDIHGFGREQTSCLPRLLHGIVGMTCTAKCTILYIIPNGSRCKELPAITKEISYINIQNVKIKCQYYIHPLLMNTKLKPKNLQHMSVTTKGITTSVLLAAPSLEYIYIWIILAIQIIMSQNHHIVNIHWPCNSNMDNWTQEVLINCTKIQFRLWTEQVQMLLEDQIPMELLLHQFLYIWPHPHLQNYNGPYKYTCNETTIVSTSLLHILYM